ncbi:hypothetical protein [Paenibacillus rubinfantis]|uniref:hypothetical protein n=1 Tax=Paenibacillus rubinfantis TaxID=1720296 RepID=UPI00073EF96E|nr:hypothetical protein [Paenibacillus rubinfantis]
MKLPFHVIWHRICSNADQIKIKSPHYRNDSYRVQGDYVMPNCAEIRMHKRYFEEAWAMMPVTDPDDLHGLISPSYLIALLSHERIGGAPAAVEWIQTEFFAGYPFGYFKLRFLPDGTVEYACDGEDLPFVLPSDYQWQASKRVFQNLAMVILARPWEQEPDPRLDAGMVCDGWTDTLSWSIDGMKEEHSFVLSEGPASLLKVMDRIRRLAKVEVR